MTPETAPRDSTQILGDFGLPWLQVAAWCPTSEKWAVANMQASHSPDQSGETLDVWFETEYEKHEQLRSWVSLPNDHESRQEAVATDSCGLPERPSSHTEGAGARPRKH